MSSFIIGMIALASAAPAWQEAQLPESLDLTTVRALVTQHDGRWPPLDTVARDIVEQVTDESVWQGHDPVTVLLAWTFDPTTWKQQPLIEIDNAELRGELQLPDSQTVFSFDELVAHQYLMKLVDDLSRSRGKMDPLQSKVSDIRDKLYVLSGAFNGDPIRLIPEPNDLTKAWRPIVMPSTDEQREKADPVSAAWADLSAAFRADDAADFTAASDRLVEALATLPAPYRPGPTDIRTELLYNAIQPFKTAWIVMVIGAVLAAAAMVVRRKWFDMVALFALVVGFGLLTYGLWLRWQIAGRIPASNMFESLLFLSWGMGLFAILAMIGLRNRMVPLTASAMAALALILADVLPLDSFVRPIQPVLQDTIWMSIHVPIIMVSYSVLALGVLVAHVQVFVMATAPGQRRLAGVIDSLHYWYIHVGAILLLVGITTGSMWGASSWGRYWGWDPKEVWSLVALLGYLIIMHVRLDHEKVPAWAYALGAAMTIALFVIVVPLLAPLTAAKVLGLVGALVGMAILVLARGRFATAAKSILCFWLIIMTYVGVNYVLGSGLHSYGFGTGAVSKYMFLSGGIDLALLALASVFYLVRRGSQPRSLAA